MLKETNPLTTLQRQAESGKAQVETAFQAVREAFKPARDLLPMPGKPFSEVVVPAVAGSLTSIDAFATTLSDNTVACRRGDDGHWPRRIQAELANCAQLIQLYGQAQSLLTTEDQQRAFQSIYEAGARVFNSCVDARDFFCDPAGVAGS